MRHVGMIVENIILSLIFSFKHQSILSVFLVDNRELLGLHTIVSCVMRLVSDLINCKIWSTHYHMCKLSNSLLQLLIIWVNFNNLSIIVVVLALLITGTKGAQLQFQLVISLIMLFKLLFFMKDLLKWLLCCYFSISPSFLSPVAPIRYAHLVAQQMGQIMKFEDFLEHLEAELLLGLHKSIEGSMFFYWGYSTTLCKYC